MPLNQQLSSLPSDSFRRNPVGTRLVCDRFSNTLLPASVYGPTAKQASDLAICPSPVWHFQKATVIPQPELPSFQTDPKAVAAQRGIDNHLGPQKHSFRFSFTYWVRPKIHRSPCVLSSPHRSRTLSLQLGKIKSVLELRHLSGISKLRRFLRPRNNDSAYA